MNTGGDSDFGVIPLWFSHPFEADRFPIPRSGRCDLDRSWFAKKFIGNLYSLIIRC
jgi:hypothetical protein